jgi:hypothetical protein
MMVGLQQTDNHCGRGGMPDASKAADFPKK